VIIAGHGRVETANDPDQRLQIFFDFWKAVRTGAAATRSSAPLHGRAKRPQKRA
jgi:hypothetical protein